MPAFGFASAAIASVLALGSMGYSVSAAAADDAAMPVPAASVAPAAAPAPDAAAMEAGRQLFVDWSCGSCHELADAGANGHVGPTLDGDVNLTKEFVIGRVTNGQGAMPSFGGLLTEAEIATLADYLAAASKPASE